MMNFLILMIFSVSSWALPLPADWSSAYRIIERHEFYAEGKLITEPRDSWQHLFSIRILSEDFTEQKDCVFYYVPGELPGKLKIKTIGVKESCLDQLMTRGDETWEDVKGLQYSSLASGLKLSFTHKKEAVTWEIIATDFKSPWARHPYVFLGDEIPKVCPARSGEDVGERGGPPSCQRSTLSRYQRRVRGNESLVLPSLS